MNKKFLTLAIIAVILVIGSLSFMLFHKEGKKKITNSHEIEAMVLEASDSTLTIKDNKDIIYTFNVKNIDVDVGDNILIEYSGLLDRNTKVQEVTILNYTTLPVTNDENGIPNSFLDDGIFSDYYILASNKLKKLSLDEKIGQLLLVRLPDTNAVSDLKKYKFSGFVFFGKDFRNKTFKEVKSMVENLQNNANIPLLTAVDEEGGNVVRVSSNPNLVEAKFKSSQELYSLGGFDLIKEDTIRKSKVLSDLGLNLNLAPVVDVSTNSSDYMYERSFGKDTALTSTYAETVINASKNTSVSYTLKHFPGYGNNMDTHTGEAIDNRSYDDIKNNDLPPFAKGIKAGAEAILVSHNKVTSIDDNNPASLSASVHNILRNDLRFTGIIMTDDLDMGATSSIADKEVKAILAGNDLIITTDYEQSFNAIKNAINDGTISENIIDKLVFRVLAWKYYKGLMIGK